MRTPMRLGASGSNKVVVISALGGLLLAAGCTRQGTEMDLRKASSSAGLSATPAAQPQAQMRVARETNLADKVQVVVMNDGPMVIYRVELAIVASDYATVRGTLDRILAAQGGFAAQMTATDTKSAAQSIEATLRVPAKNLAATIAELKKMGRVEKESHVGKEVTQQYTDLNARLLNARNTEKRLIAVLNERTGKVKDILEVEQEISRVREQIETMDAERRTMENQVQLATVYLQIREDYKAALEVAPPTLGTRLWNAFARGVFDARESMLGVLLFLLNAGPTLLLWTIILFLPGRAAWRRIRPRFVQPNIA